MVKNKSKPSLGFGDDLEEILENPEATVDDANGQEVEYTRNLMYKINSEIQNKNLFIVCDS